MCFTLDYLFHSQSADSSDGFHFVFCVFVCVRACSVYFFFFKFEYVEFYTVKGIFHQAPMAYSNLVRTGYLKRHSCASEIQFWELKNLSFILLVKHNKKIIVAYL